MKRIFLALVLVGALAGCGSATSGSGNASTSDTSSSPAPTTASSSHGQAANTSTPAPTSSAAPSAPPPAATAECVASNLTVTNTPLPGGNAAGHQGVVILLTNGGTSPCYVIGYPGADGTDASGHSLAHAVRTLSGMLGGCSCTKPAKISLQVGDHASAVVEATSGGPGPCTAFGGLLVTPPDTETSTQLDVQLPSCGFQVHPMVAGMTGGSPS